MNEMKKALWALGVSLVLTDAQAMDHGTHVEHYDALPYDEHLSLREVVDATFEQYPQGSVITALEDEAKALDRRSSSLIHGYPMIYLQYIDDKVISDQGQVDLQTGYQVPVWMWGQRAASRAVANEADKSAQLFSLAIKLEVAGLVREALWNLTLVENRHELAEQVYEFSSKLFQTVKRRVEVGDLARSDQLLAESDLLEKQSLLTLAEAEVMHARKAYMNLTRLNKAPRTFSENQNSIREISETHPAVEAANAVIERAQAEVEYTRLSKQGNQPSILLGTNHDRGRRHESLNSSINVVLQIPIGGEAYNGPFVAQANVELGRKLANRDSLLRSLERALHEAQHNLEVDHATLEIANQRKSIAETHLKMSRLAFESGEIQLIDYLKIQSNAQAAIRDARERAIMLQRDTAFYNQVVGVMP